MFTAWFLILVDDLQAVVVDVLFVQKVDVLGRTVISLEYLDVVVLDLSGLLDNAFIGVGYAFSKEPFPFAFGKGVVIEEFKLSAEVRYQFGFIADLQVFISL
jgi:hypothetical protein